MQLPELGVARALRNLVMYQDDYQLLDRDINLIDLRVASLVAVRPNKTEEQLAEDEKKRKEALAERARSPNPFPMPPRTLPSQNLPQPAAPQ